MTDHPEACDSAIVLLFLIVCCLALVAWITGL
jgi:hypothetical protein